MTDMTKAVLAVFAAFSVACWSNLSKQLTEDEQKDSD